MSLSLVVSATLIVGVNITFFDTLDSHCLSYAHIESSLSSSLD